MARGRLARGKGRVLRVVKKKQQRKKGATTMVSRRTPFADRFLTKLKYIDAIRFQGTGLLTFYQHQMYRANGLFDTDYSNNGRNAQPMGFDALCGPPKNNAPYASYTGRNCYIKLDLINNSAQPFWVVLFPSREVSTPASATEAFEQAYSKFKIVPGNTTTPKSTIYHKFSTAKMFAETQNTINTEDNYTGTYSGIPANNWYWNIYMVSMDGSTALDVYSRIELIYDVEFSDRNQLTQS